MPMSVTHRATIPRTHTGTSRNAPATPTIPARVGFSLAAAATTSRLSLKNRTTAKARIAMMANVIRFSIMPPIPRPTCRNAPRTPCDRRDSASGAARRISRRTSSRISSRSSESVVASTTSRSRRIRLMPPSTTPPSRDTRASARWTSPSILASSPTVSSPPTRMALPSRYPWTSRSLSMRISVASTVSPDSMTTSSPR